MPTILDTPSSSPTTGREPPAATTFIPPAAPAVESPTHPAAPAAPPPPRAPKRAPRHPHLRARLVTAGIVLAVVGGIAYAMRPTPLVVDVAPLRVGPMQTTVEVDAVTRVRDRFVVTAPVAGLVQRSVLREGDAVRAGDVVATIVTPPVYGSERRAVDERVEAARAAKLQADARVTQAAQGLAQAVRDHGRARMLLDAGGIAERDAELAALTETNRRAELNTAQAQRRIAVAELTQADAALAAATGSAGATTLVRAPAAGRVLGMPERSARIVAAGTPLLTVGDPRTLEIAADVLSSDAATVRAGQPVVLRGWGGAPLRGVVRTVDPSARTRVSALGVEEQRLTVVIDLPDAPATLGDGYRLDASIVVWESPQVAMVPAGALLRSDDAWELFVVRGERAERVRARIGRIGGGTAEVLGGVARGERVVVFPPDALRDGMRVQAEE